MEIRSQFRAELLRRIGEERFELWFKTARIALEGETLVVALAERFACDWVRKHFRGDLDAICNDLLGSSRPIEFRVDGSLKPPPEEAKSPARRAAGGNRPHSAAGSAADDQAPLLGRRRFASLATFVEGDCNRLPLTAVQRLLDQPGSVSPLVLFGPTGVGKSHLLEGIWCQLRQRSKSRRVIYLTAEQFTSHFLEALHGGGLPQFRHKYRDTQVLLIDDVQFFTGKRATIMELQHTLDAMIREGRQVVLTADRRPSEIGGLPPELIARMEEGLLCELQPVDGATRLEVARRLAAQRSISIPDDVLELVARRISGDVRRISGALNRLQAASAAYEQPISQRLASQCLADLWGDAPTAIELETIERVVSECCGVPIESLRSAQRARPISQSRMLAMWLARKFTRVAYKDIGCFFGRRSHSTVISAQKTVNEWLENEASLELGHGSCNARDLLRRLEEKLKAG